VKPETPPQAAAVTAPSPAPSPTPTTPAASDDASQLKSPGVTARKPVQATPSAAVSIEKKPVTANVISGDKKTVLREALKVKSAENVQRLRDALKNAPETSKPALKQAIEKAESGYQKVLEEKSKGTVPVIPAAPQNINPLPRSGSKDPSAVTEPQKTITLTPIPATPLPKKNIIPVAPRPALSPSPSPTPSPQSRRPVDSDKKAEKQN
jgi:hypothetical protein